jgi:diguanylate cyclase (GGDEF)-like protein
MTADLPMQTILDKLATRIAAALPIDGAGVTLLGPAMAPEYIAASDEVVRQVERLQLRLGGPCRQAWETDRTVFITDLSADGPHRRFRIATAGFDLRAAFSFPLRHGSLRVGSLDLYTSEPGELDPSDVATAQTLADVVAACAITARARQSALEAAGQFREWALHDSLTGVANRVLLQERLLHAAQRAERSGKVTAVVFIDLDRFKEVNDSYGHDVGDALLVAVTERLAGLVRPGDTLARISGDEFVILCEDVDDVSHVEALQTRIRSAFRRQFVLGKQRLRISASLGIAYAAPGEPVSGQLLIRADAAMYRSKRRHHRQRHRVIDLDAAERRSHTGG